MIETIKSKPWLIVLLTLLAAWFVIPKVLRKLA